MFPDINVKVPFYKPAGVGGTMTNNQPVAASVLSKMLSFWGFEDTLTDSWGVAPITLNQLVAPTYGTATDYGAGPAGRCLLTGQLESNPILLYPATQEVTFIAMLSTDVFTNNAAVIGTGNGSDLPMAFSEGNDGDAKWRARTTTTGFVAKTVTTPTDKTINTWSMLSHHVIPASGAELHNNATMDYDSIVYGDALLPSLRMQLGQGSGTAGTSSKISFATLLTGNLSQAELTYLYNSGTTRSISDIISDANYSRPTMRMDAQIAALAMMAASYDGKRIASQLPDLTGNRLRVNNAISSGLKYITVQVKRTLKTAANTTVIGLISSTAGTDGVFVQCGASAGSVAAFGTGFTVVDATAFVAAVVADDYITVAVNETTGKGWFGRNGTMDGNPVAGTGENFTFAPGTTLYPYVYSDDNLFHASVGMLTADMPHTITGFTAWGS